MVSATRTELLARRARIELAEMTGFTSDLRKRLDRRLLVWVAAIAFLYLVTLLIVVPLGRLAVAGAILAALALANLVRMRFERAYEVLRASQPPEKVPDEPDQL